MAWNDAPPTKDELAKAPARWDAEPPTKDELAQAEKVAVRSNIDKMNESGDTSNDAIFNTLTLGYLPQIKAKAKQILAGGGLANDDQYVKLRDQEIAEEKARADKYPAAHREGEAVGFVAPMLATGGGSALEEAAPSIAKLIGKSAVTGAAIGGAANPGDKEGEVDALQLGDRAKNAALGGVGGAALGAAIPAASAGASKLAGAARDFAEKRAYAASGPMLKDVRTAVANGKVNDLGRFMLDNQLVKAGDTFDDIAGRAEALRQSAGQKLDDIYSEAVSKFGQGSKTVGFDPVRDKPAIMARAKQELGDTVDGKAALQKLSDYLDDVAENHANPDIIKARAEYQKDVADYVPKYRQYLKDRAAYREAVGAAGADASQPILPGMVDDLQRTEKVTSPVEVNGKPATTATVDGPRYPVRDGNAVPRILSNKEFMDLPAAADGQAYLPDLPTANSEVARVYGKPGEANFGDQGGDTLKRVGSNVAKSLEADAQRKFLDQYTAEQIGLFGKQGEMQGLELTPRSYKDAELPAVVGRDGQTKMILEPQAPQRPVAREVGNAMSPREANDVKGAIDRAINYARNPLTPDPAKEQALFAARQAISEHIDRGIQELGGDESLAALKAANKDYGMAKTISRTAGDRANRVEANEMLSLSDRTAGAAGAAALGPKGLALAVANKVMRTRGNATAAVTADALSNFLMRSRSLQRVAAENPVAFRGAILDLTDRLNGSSTLPIQKAAGNELDKNSSTSSSTPLKGQDKWASDGFTKLSQHAGKDVQLDRKSLMADPRTKSLLIQASDLTPGTKAMNDIMNRMKAASKGK